MVRCMASEVHASGEVHGELVARGVRCTQVVRSTANEVHASSEVHGELGAVQVRGRDSVRSGCSRLLWAR